MGPRHPVPAPAPDVRTAGSTLPGQRARCVCHAAVDGRDRSRGRCGVAGPPYFAPVAYVTNPTIPGVTPTNPYGQDFAIVIVGGVLDFLPTMGLATGRTLLQQSLICRQTTPTGSVVDCPNDCFDVRDWISEGMTAQQLAQIGTTISNELMKDQRVSMANVT